MFLVSQTKRSQVILSLIPGPAEALSKRPIRTFTFWPYKFDETFLIEKFFLMPNAQKAIFYSAEHLGEISLANYPFLDGSGPPEIKVHSVFLNDKEKEDEKDSDDKSTQINLLHI